MEQIDARGQACPLPVVRAKKALSAMGEGVLEVLVDNETAVHNLEALAKTLKVGAVGEERGEGVFAVTSRRARRQTAKREAPRAARRSSNRLRAAGWR